MVQLRWTTAQVRFLIDGTLDIVFVFLDLSSLNNSQVLKKIFSNNESMERLKKTSPAVLIEGRVHSTVACLKKCLSLSSFVEPAKKTEECEQRILVWKHSHLRKEWMVSIQNLFLVCSRLLRRFYFSAYLYLYVHIYICIYIVYISWWTRACLHIHWKEHFIDKIVIFARFPVCTDNEKKRPPGRKTNVHSRHWSVRCRFVDL